MKIQSIVSLLLLLSPAYAQDSRLIFTIPPGTYSTGSPVAILPDINGDGFDDFLLGDVSHGRFSALSGRDGSLLYQTPQRSGRFPFSVASIPDLNGDGVRDLAMGAPDEGLGGRVEIIDPLTGLTFQTIVPGADAREFGFCVSEVEDIDGDNVSDIMISDPAWTVSGVQRGSVAIYSTRLWAPLFFITGPTSGFGAYASQISDVDGDGTPDVVTGSPNNQRIYITSGRTFQGIRAIAPPHSRTNNFGRFIDASSDLNNDGVSDLVASYGSSSNPAYPQYATGASAFSGSSGSILWSITDVRRVPSNAYRVLTILDQDGDAVPDVFLGSPFRSTVAPIHLFSGSTGNGIFAIGDQPRTSGLGEAISFGGDINADGQHDFLAGGANTAAVFSSVPLPLTTDRQDVSYGALNSQVLRLRAGPQHAGKLYQVLGSYSGISPGFPLPPAGILPLNLDDYFVMSYQYPGYPPFINFRYTLDANGEATAYWTPLPGFPEIVGFRLDHAFAVLGPTGIDFISNSVPLTVLP